MEKTWFPSELPIAAPYAVVFPRSTPALLAATGHAAYSVFLHPTAARAARPNPEEQSLVMRRENKPIANVVGRARYSYRAGWLPGLPFGSASAAIHTVDEVETVESNLLKVSKDG